MVSPLEFTGPDAYSVTADSIAIDTEPQKSFATDFAGINSATTFTNVTASNWRTSIIEKLNTQSVSLNSGDKLEVFPDLT